VRRAREGEQVQTLDGQTRTLDGEMVVIDDAEGPTSIAGLMGGARSEVAPDTQRVLLEVATWDGPNIHRTSAALGLRSEASSRFEKGLQPEQCLQAQAVATRLMLELCGARVAPGTIDVGSPPPPPQVIRLREQRVQAILGVPVARDRQEQILNALDFATQPAEDGLDVTVPALRRADVTREVDLIEEGRAIDGPRAPARHPAGAARRRRSADPPPARAARGPRTPSPGAGCTRSSVGASPTPRCWTGCGCRPITSYAGSSPSRTRSPRRSRSCARRCSARCSTPPGTTSPATARTSPSSSPAPYIGRRAKGSWPTSTTGSARC